MVIDQSCVHVFLHISSVVILSIMVGFLIQLPVIARRMGKRAFKPHLQSFFDVIFYALVGTDIFDLLVNLVSPEHISNLEQIGVENFVVSYQQTHVVRIARATRTCYLIDNIYSA